MADQNFLINSISPLGSGRFYSEVNTDQGNYVYVPQEFVYKGLRQGDTQYIDQAFLNKDYLDAGQLIRLDANNLPPSLISAGYQDPTLGVLFKKEDWNKYDPNGESITTYNATGKFAGDIRGIGEKDGNLVYSFVGAGGSTYGYVDQAGTPIQTTVIPGKTKFGFIGKLAKNITEAIAGVPFLPEIAGIATGNPALYASLKGAQTAGEGGNLEDVIKSAGTAYVGANIAQGLLGAPTGVETGAFDIAGNPDILGGSSAVALGNVSPEPGAFDVGGNPDIMVQQPPTTGAFDVSGATGTGLEMPAEPTTGAFDVGGNPDIMGNQPISLSDAFRALRTANSINSLLNPQQPQGTAMQGGAPMAATGVDYSGLYSLLGQRPVQTGLLGTQYQPQPINLASLLG